MIVKEDKFGTVTSLAPAGPITSDDRRQLLEALNRILASPNPRLVIGMGEVPYVDSSGLELFLDIAHDLRGRGLPLKLADLTTTCREILDLTEMLKEFELYNTVEDAVRSFL